MDRHKRMLGVLSCKKLMRCCVVLDYEQSSTTFKAKVRSYVKVPFHTISNMSSCNLNFPKMQIHDPFKTILQIAYFMTENEEYPESSHLDEVQAT